MNDREKLIVFVATPLEPEHVERIQNVDRDRIEVIYEPDLLPPTRYAADHKGVDGFVLTEAQERRWRSHLGRAHVLWDFPPPASDGTEGLALATNLRWIQTTSSGVGQRVQRLGLDRSDILITTARGVHAGPLSEFVFLTLLSHVKRLRHLQDEQRKHGWERLCTDELEGKTLAIVGAGGVGRRVAAVGKAFGMRVVASRRRGSVDTAAEGIGVDALFPPESLHAMLAAADVLVLSVPHTKETEGLIDRAALAALKPGAVFVNVARGQVVDEGALIEALASGRIAFAGLDVFRVEPLPKDSPLWDLPNVLISPHSASTASSENRRITDVFCHNLRCYLDSRPEDMMNVFDKARLY
jgi:phosphoglycerate dehydrogenase-like enzyme